MKKLVVVVALIWFCGSPASPAADTYPLTVHVSSSQIANYGTVSNRTSVVDTILNDKKYEMTSIVAPRGALLPGDYKARLLSDEAKKPYEVTQMYEFLFPDGKTEKYTVTGVSE